MLGKIHVLTLMLKIMIKFLNLKFGDHIRISMCQNMFTKGYASDWSEEVFVIE